MYIRFRQKDIYIYIPLYIDIYTHPHIKPISTILQKHIFNQAKFLWCVCKEGTKFSSRTICSRPAKLNVKEGIPKVTST